MLVNCFVWDREQALSVLDNRPQTGLFLPTLGYCTLRDFCCIPEKLSANRIVRERLQFLKRIQANRKCLETLHKAPALSSKVEPVFGSGCWLGCVRAGVLGFVEFCIPTLHLWGRGVSNIGLWLTPVSVSAFFQGSVRS